MELSAAVIFYLLFDLLLTSVSSVKVHYLYWNSSNPIFRIDNTDHIVDVNQGNSPFEFDQLNIICPSGQGGVPGGRGSRGTGEDERYLVYNVSKEEYDTCRINQQNPKVVAQCDNPDRPPVTITFRSFSPSPRGLEFHPGQDYYFISTSSRSDLHRRVGGSCSTHNMKVIFKVADTSDRRPAPAINTARQPQLRLEQSEARSPYVRPIGDVRQFHTGMDEASKQRYDRDQNIKQEASTATHSGAGGMSMSALIFCLLLFLSRQSAR